MSKINFCFSRVRISEFPGMVKGMLGVVAKHNPASLKIEGMYLIAQDNLPLLDLFFEPAKSDYTEPIEELRKQRAQVISATLLQMKAAGLSSVPTITAASEVILPAIRKYLDKVLVNNGKVISEKVDGFLETYLASPDLTAAGNTLGIHVYIMRLKELRDSIGGKEKARTAAKAERRLANPVALRKKISRSLSNLTKAIEVAEVENVTIDYGLLNAELAEFLVPFNTLVKSRTTRAKNSEADKNTTAADTSSTTDTAAI